MVICKALNRVFCCPSLNLKRRGSTMLNGNERGEEFKFSSVTRRYAAKVHDIVGNAKTLY